MWPNRVDICLQKAAEQKDGAAGETVHFYLLFRASHCLIHLQPLAPFVVQPSLPPLIKVLRGKLLSARYLSRCSSVIKKKNPGWWEMSEMFYYGCRANSCCLFPRMRLINKQFFFFFLNSAIWAARLWEEADYMKFLGLLQLFRHLMWIPVLCYMIRIEHWIIQR